LSRASLVGAGVVAAAALAVACYNPSIRDGAFQCTQDEGFLCPTGLTCDRSTGLCVQHLSTDAGVGDALPRFDFSGPPAPRSCDERVIAGAFSHLTTVHLDANIGHSLALSPDGAQLYWYDGAGTFTTAAVGSDKKTIGAPAAVALSGAPTTINGGSFAADGSYWFAGFLSPSWSLYQATRTNATTFTVGAAHLPTSGCAFQDPAFGAKVGSTSELYVSAPLGVSGCGTAADDFIAQGTADKQMGAFYGAFPGRGYSSPFVLPGGSTLLAAATQNGTSRLVYTTRASTDVQWASTSALPLGGADTTSPNDLAAVVSPDCSTFYFIGKRPQGTGIFAADIAAP
jgi:hypothetical protein